MRFALNSFFFKDFIYLFMRDTEAETQVEGEAGSLQGAQCGIWYQDPRITPWAESRHSTTEPPRCPYKLSLLEVATIKNLEEVDLQRFTACFF